MTRSLIPGERKVEANSTAGGLVLGKSDLLALVACEGYVRPSAIEVHQGVEAS